MNLWMAYEYETLILQRKIILVNKQSATYLGSFQGMS